MDSSIADLEEDKKQYVDQLDIVYNQIKDDPDNAELHMLASELADAVIMIDESINELRPKRQDPAPKKAAASPTPPPAPPPPPEKWSRENHPAFKKSGGVTAEDAAADGGAGGAAAPSSALAYKVNDSVLAKWVSGDKAFYPARITSMTGSSTDPVYIVKFKSYDTTETLRAKDIRPVPAQKRKADGPPAADSAASSSSAAAPAAPVSAPTTTTGYPSPLGGGPAVGPGVVTSAAARINPEAAREQAERLAAGADAKPKFKKIKANKALEAGKNKWQDFNNKGKHGKGHKKDSMFRTPDGVNGRVGFTGSGQAMRKDPTRSRHVYQPNEELD